jgi:hypothetical protein
MNLPPQTKNKKYMKRYYSLMDNLCEFLRNLNHNTEYYETLFSNNKDIITECISKYINSELS